MVVMMKAKGLAVRMSWSISHKEKKKPNTCILHLHPRTSSSQRSPSPGPNHVATSSSNSHHSSSGGGGSNSSNPSSAPNSASGSRPSSSFTPTLAAHFNESLIKHVQGWPADHAEKQVGGHRCFRAENAMGICQCFFAVYGGSSSLLFWLLITLFPAARRRGYGRRPTPWAASACRRTAPSSRTCAPWSGCVRYKPRCGNRGTVDKGGESS